LKNTHNAKLPSAPQVKKGLEHAAYINQTEKNKAQRELKQQNAIVFPTKKEMEDEAYASNHKAETQKFYKEEYDKKIEKEKEASPIYHPYDNVVAPALEKIIGEKGLKATEKIAGNPAVQSALFAMFSKGKGMGNKVPYAPKLPAPKVAFNKVKDFGQGNIGKTEVPVYHTPEGTTTRVPLYSDGKPIMISRPVNAKKMVNKPMNIDFKKQIKEQVESQDPSTVIGRGTGGKKIYSDAEPIEGKSPEFNAARNFGRKLVENPITKPLAVGTEATIRHGKNVIGYPGKLVGKAAKTIMNNKKNSAIIGGAGAYFLGRAASYDIGDLPEDDNSKNKSKAQRDSTMARIQKELMNRQYIDSLDNPEKYKVK